MYRCCKNQVKIQLYTNHALLSHAENTNTSSIGRPGQYQVMMHYFKTANNKILTDTDLLEFCQHTLRTSK